MKSIKILYLGAKSTGKSSLSILLLNEIISVIKKHNINVTEDKIANSISTYDYNMYIAILSDEFVIRNFPKPTRKLKTFEIYGNTRNKKRKLFTIRFEDLPGVTFNKLKRKKHLRSISKSDYIIICLDSPYLYYESGKYFKERNLIDKIETILKGKAIKKQKVVFALMKSEGCGATDELIGIFKKRAESSIKILEDRGNINYMILPIYSMGGVVFDGFKEKIEEEFPKSIYKRKSPKASIEPYNVDYLARYILSGIEYNKETKKLIEECRRAIGGF